MMLSILNKDHIPPDLPNFKEGTTQYTYDRNGNMIEETGREFTIAYNHLNLPVQVTGSYNGTVTNIFYTYTFDGMKLRRRTVDGDVETLTDYVGPFVFETINGQRRLRYILMPEGRLYNTAAYGQNPVWEWQYFLKDHLGNVRLVIRGDHPSTAIVCQENHYYSFGMLERSGNPAIAGRMADLGSEHDNPYLYNGKEFQPDLELNWYDYGARFYDPALGRWHVIDPLAEKYSSISPYAYCVNNPLRFIDPDGKRIVLAGTQVQMQQTLSTLQKLTNDQLTVNYSTGVVKIPTLSIGGNLSSGTALIRELNSKLPGAKTVTIDNQNSTGIFPAGTTGNVAGHMPSLDATNGVGVDANVNFDPTSNPTITTEDPATGNAQGTNRPNEIGLGHELIHSQHYMTGTKGTGTTTYTYKDAAGNTQTTSDKTEEVNTVGIGGSSKFTENKLRQEHRAAVTTPAQQNQLNPRIKY